MSTFIAELKNGKTVPVGDLDNGWQAFFCANMDYPGQVKNVCPDVSNESSEIEQEQA